MYGHLVVTSKWAIRYLTVVACVLVEQGEARDNIDTDER